MARKDILWCGHPTLRKKARPVREITDEVRQLLADMAQTIEEVPGLGLAAPQVDESVRAIVAREDVGEDHPVYALVNPRVIRRAGRSEGIEGCLSLPTLQGTVERAAKVTVRGLDPDGQIVEVEAEGMLARCLQHEIDHLDGILFVDRADPDTLAWMIPDEDDEDGYRIEPTTLAEIEAAFERLRQKREAARQAAAPPDAQGAG
jgi:peptide deformylase